MCQNKRLIEYFFNIFLKKSSTIFAIISGTQPFLIFTHR